MNGEYAGVLRYHSRQLDTIDEIVNKDPDRTGTLTILGMIGLLTVNEQFLTRMRSYSDYLPKPGRSRSPMNNGSFISSGMKDVSPDAVVAGIPATIIRPRKNEGLFRERLNHI